MNNSDQQLLDALASDARASVTELAKTLRCSRTTVQARIERLQKSGVIAGFTLRLGIAHATPRLEAQALLRINPRCTQLVLAQASQIEAVYSVHSVAGEFDLLVHLSCRHATELDNALDALAAIEGVERTQSCVLLQAKFRRS